MWEYFRDKVGTWMRCLRPLSEEVSRAEKGRQAERMAEKWLRRNCGYRLVSRNWRHGRGEIDLIMHTPNDELAFIEVRARSETAQVSGYHSISPAKRKLLRRTAEAYLRRLDRIPAWKFDVVELAWSPPHPPDIRHFTSVSLR